MKNFLSRVVPFIKKRYAPRGARLSFSASGEDLIMSDCLKKLGVEDVSYIDIGAHDPVFGNNTYLFYKSGGRGIMVEPNEDLCIRIRAKRPRDIVVNAGAGKEDGEANFYLFERSTRSTFSESQAGAWEEVSGQRPIVAKCQLLSLDTIIEKYGGKKAPDVVSIDAEGLDKEILSGFSWVKRPKVFCIEMSDGIRSLMEEHNYELVASAFQNAIFVDTMSKK